ncbi:SMI1/KNR4 family protein [Streptomyces sp. NPDC088725]|uniref:SMI1/KNR4 family protein n=1 Tax=Streptomyces sp. NPDC088725 TaxID=3365873 RepID=UPI00380E8669
MKIYNWRPFLERWSADWADSPGAREGKGADEDSLRERWLGFPAVRAEVITALEERLGAALPPTYRSFLATTDGWRHAGPHVRLMGRAGGVGWYRDAPDLQEPGGPALSGDSPEREPLTAGVRDRSLRLTLESDGTALLLDPGDVNADGEWAAYICRDGGRPPERHESFMDLMQALFRQFHRANSAVPGFVNETTRDLDADVEEARLACLAGEDVDDQLDVLRDAEEHGRPHARELRLQLTALLDGGLPDADASREAADCGRLGRLDDPWYVKEFLPLAAREHLRSGGDEESFLPVPGPGAGGERSGVPAGDRERALTVLRAVRDRTFAYEAAGAFGKAVGAAREEARWGDTDAAWRTMAAAVGGWEPYGSGHVAPIGLLADPILGGVITPERGRYILETPRAEGLEQDGGTAGDTDGGPDDEAHEDGVSDGLEWLADQDPERGDYRFVLVHGVSPEDLAGRMGQGPLLPPSSTADVLRYRLDGVTVARAGSGGAGWSFLFEDRMEPFPQGRPAGPGEAVSRGTRSVTVWCEIAGRPESPSAFHFSCAEDGRSAYGFTVRGGEIERWGTIPPSLDPQDLFPGSVDGGAALDPDDEYEALAAITEEFGVSLPHLALRQGRLHAVAVAPWAAAARSDDPDPAPARDNP